MVPWPRAHRSHLALLAAAPFVLPTETFSALQLRRLHGGTGRYWLLCTRGLESEAEDLVRQVRQNWREKHRKGTTFWCLDDTLCKSRVEIKDCTYILFVFFVLCVYCCLFLLFLWPSCVRVWAANGLGTIHSDRYYQSITTLRERKNTVQIPFKCVCVCVHVLSWYLGNEAPWVLVILTN